METETTNPLDQITTDLLNDRDKATAEKNAAEARVKAINIRLEQLLALGGVGRHQASDGSVVYMVSPSAREVVMPEKLLARGVDAKIIQESTVVSPVKPYVRVDRPKPTDAESVGPREAGEPGDQRHTTPTIQ